MQGSYLRKKVSLTQLQSKYYVRLLMFTCLWGILLVDIFWSCDTSTFTAMVFWGKSFFFFFSVRKRKHESLRVSNFTLLLVVFKSKWHPGSEGVKLLECRVLWYMSRRLLIQINCLELLKVKLQQKIFLISATKIETRNSTHTKKEKKNTRK